MFLVEVSFIEMRKPVGRTDGGGADDMILGVLSLKCPMTAHPVSVKQAFRCARLEFQEEVSAALSLHRETFVNHQCQMAFKSEIRPAPSGRECSCKWEEGRALGHPSWEVWEKKD